MLDTLATGVRVVPSTCSTAKKVDEMAEIMNANALIEGADHIVPAADRRKRNIPVAVDRRRQNAAEKRRTSERRRLIDPTTCERDYTDEETVFMKAMERYKRENRRPFPTWNEVLEVIRSLGYEKIAAESDLPGIKRDVPPKG
jgi:hypothetical protein